MHILLKQSQLLSCSMVQVVGRPNKVSHRSNCGKASENKEAARDTLSASVVDRLVDGCFLHNHASGKEVRGPAKARNPPEVERVDPESPQKSASVKQRMQKLSVGSPICPHNM